jgi:ribosomal protein S27AE
MSERPFPKGWKAKVNGFKDALAKRAAERPDLRISVAPKGPRASGPHPAGDTWHLPLSQAEMQAEAEAQLSKKRCAGCGERVIIASGELVEGLWCGRCYGERERPPAA